MINELAYFRLVPVVASLGNSVQKVTVVVRYLKAVLKLFTLATAATGPSVGLLMNF